MKAKKETNRTKQRGGKQMRGYRVKYDKRSFKVQVRFLLFWRTLAVYPIEYGHMGVARKEANAIASELIKRSN